MNYFNTCLNNLALAYGFDIARWDKLNYDELSFDDMESKQSVHLRPSSYMNFDKLKTN